MLHWAVILQKFVWYLENIFGRLQKLQIFFCNYESDLKQGVILKNFKYQNTSIICDFHVSFTVKWSIWRLYFFIINNDSQLQSWMITNENKWKMSKRYEYSSHWPPGARERRTCTFTLTQNVSTGISVEHLYENANSIGIRNSQQEVHNHISLSFIDTE